MYIFEKYLYFRHSKLKIALAIPASNDEKHNWNNSAGQGLSVAVFSRSKSCGLWSMCIGFPGVVNNY